MEELKNKYKEVFGKYEIPETLQKLIQFEEKYGGGSYSDGFYLNPELDKTPDMGQYSLDEEYFERLLVFANADFTGSQYAFWVNEIGVLLEEAPIVVIDSEGGWEIVAKNIKEIIKLLSFDTETLSYKDDDFEGSKNASEFRKWMKNELGIKPIKNIDVNESEEVNSIIEDAKQKYQELFRKWMLSLTPQYDSYDDY